MTIVNTLISPSAKEEFANMGLDAFDAISQNRPSFAELDPQTSKQVCHHLFRLYFPCENLQHLDAQEARSKLLSIYKCCMTILRQQIPSLQNRSIIEAFLKGDVQGIQAQSIPDEQKQKLYRLAATNGHIPALSCLDPKGAYDCLIAAIKYKTVPSVLQGMVASVKNQLPTDKLIQVLYQATLANPNYTDISSFPVDALRLTLLKLVESNATKSVMHHLDARKDYLEIEDYVEAYQLAKERKHLSLAAEIQKALRKTFVTLSQNWKKEKLIRWLECDLITDADEKRAARFAHSAKQYEIAHYLIQKTGLYYTNDMQLKSISREPFKKMAIIDKSVPRESTIKFKLSDFLFHFHVHNQQVRITPYQGQQVHPEVNKFPIFSKYGPMPDMKNGHVLLNDEITTYDRCLVLKTKKGIQGAIGYAIDVPEGECIITRLEVKKDHQKRNFGQTLLHSALFVGLLYKCTEFTTQATSKSLEFYKKQGFVGEHAENDPDNGGDLSLKLSDQSSRHILLEKMSKTAPYYPLTQTVEIA